MPPLIGHFWKFLLLALVATGCWYWWTKSQTQQAYAFEIAQLAEILDYRLGDKPEPDEKAAERTFKTLAALHSIATEAGEKFDLRATIGEAIALNNPSNKHAKILTDTIVNNYKAAQNLGLLDDHDAMWRMRQGSPPVLGLGPWIGERLIDTGTLKLEHNRSPNPQLH